MDFGQFVGDDSPYQRKRHAPQWETRACALNGLPLLDLEVSEGLGDYLARTRDYAELELVGLAFRQVCNYCFGL